MKTLIALVLTLSFSYAFAETISDGGHSALASIGFDAGMLDQTFFGISTGDVTFDRSKLCLTIGKIAGQAQALQLLAATDKLSDKLNRGSEYIVQQGEKLDESLCTGPTVEIAWSHQLVQNVLRVVWWMQEQ